MMNKDGETMQFAVHAPKADRVCLVLENEIGATTWLPMQPDGAGSWRVIHRLAGGYRVQYFTAEGGTWLNCGSFGLRARRLQEMASAG